MSMMKEYLHEELERIAVEYDTDLSDIYDYYIGYVELCDEGVMKHQDDPLEFLKGFMKWRKERLCKES